MDMQLRRGTLAAAMLAAAGLAFSGAAALAGPLETTVPRNAAAGLFPVMTYGKSDCGSYPVAELRVTEKPRHGTVTFVKKPFTLGKEAGICSGTRFEVPWLIYQPAVNYVGPDSVSISWKWTLYSNGTIMKYATKDFAITVK
ncbi:hypothetical protein [Labrys monachus]|uniref:Lipoprotein n=1 Tax=Labrys monachus TaxID=217067 RepID=A0ABU0FBS3_9HYPH|nr:hypothetical protein [Labrys monachus]MDQ0391772.1 hypothetical protein [Labrys monachus]